MHDRKQRQINRLKEADGTEWREKANRAERNAAEDQRGERFLKIRILKLVLNVTRSQCRDSGTYARDKKRESLKEAIGKVGNPGEDSALQSSEKVESKRRM